MKLRITFLLIFLPLLLTSNLHAQGFAAGIKVSTLGVQVEGIKSFSKSLNGRVGIAFFSYNLTGGGGDEDFEYEGDLKLLSISVLADYFPFQNWFRLTGGALINLNKGELTMTPTQSYTVGGVLYTPAMLGNVTADVKVNVISPYIGIGIGNPTVGKGVGFSLDIGGVYQGKPSVEMGATGLLEPSAEQAPIIEDNLSWFQFYPVVALGITFKF
ncbi:MAG: hypothetical protein V1720_10575 [bacterium]